MVYDMVRLRETQPEADVYALLLHKYAKEDMEEADAELNALKDAGLLYAPAELPPAAAAYRPVIKSLCLHVAHDCNCLLYTSRCV